MGFPILDLLSFGGKLIDKLIPDPEAKAQAQLELAKLQQSGELEVLKAETQLVQSRIDFDKSVAEGQLEINKVEASSSNMFVAGWRPFIGWSCGIGFLYQVIIAPVGTVLGMNILHWAPWPAIDSESLNTVLFGLLGLGAYRTIEKVSGKTK